MYKLRKCILLIILILLTAFMLPAVSQAKETTVNADSKNPVFIVTAKASGKTGVKLTWTKVKGATKYEVYGCTAGSKKALLIKDAGRKTSFKVTKINLEKLTKETAYSFYVVAHKGKKQLMKTDKITYIVGNVFKEKYSNTTKISVGKSSVTLTEGDSASIKVKKTQYKKLKHLPEKYGTKTRFYSDNKAVATVSNKGKIKAIMPGSATIYVADVNGLYAKVKVKVNEKMYKVSWSLPGQSIEPCVVAKGKKADKPKIKAGDRGVVSGWYKDSDCKVAWNFDKDTVTSDMTLYGAWIDPLCFTAEEADTVIELKGQGYEGAPITLKEAVNLSVSFDEGYSWTEYSNLTNGIKLTLKKAGDKVFVKGDNPNGFSGHEKCTWTFSTAKKVSAGGNIMSLVDSSCKAAEIPCEGCFESLFERSGITKAPKLCATVLKPYCYEDMFAYCNYLTESPTLPALDLPTECYKEMFSNCRNLVKAGEILATTYEGSCCMQMFNACSSLETVPDLKVVSFTNGNMQCGMMFSGCSKLQKAPAIPATEFSINNCVYMFANCKALTEAPKLKIDKLSEYSFNSMFSLCNNLTSISMNFGTIDSLPEYSMADFVGVPAETQTEGTIHVNSDIDSSLTLAIESFIPSGWSVIADME